MPDADEKPTSAHPAADANVPDLGEWIEDVVTFSTDPKRLTAKKTANAYTKVVMAAATAWPLALGSVGPVPTVSQAQEPVKRPDEHLVTQTQPEEALLEAAAELEALVSGSPSVDIETAIEIMKSRRYRIS
jgi:hypothetical protein